MPCHREGRAALTEPASTGAMFGASAATSGHLDKIADLVSKPEPRGGR